MSDMTREADAGDQLLIADFEATREDDRGGDAVATALISIGIALLGGLGVVVFKSCPMLHRTHGCLNIPRQILALLPLGPLAVLAFFAQVGTVATMRSFYLRELERELASRLGVSAGQLRRIPSLRHLTMPLVSQRRGIGPFRVLSALWPAVLLIAFGGLSALSVSLAAPLPLKLGAGLLYLVGAALFGWVTRAVFARGRELYDKLAEGLPGEFDRPLGRATARDQERVR
ncbi:MAG: hypothetical protein M3Q23_08130 [Actinomycetota bacterium]|nr:hypothetical protein [Actinomycetota bacterium]